MEVVNGYVCKTCTDVANAKKGVDPAHPKDGPNGVYKADRAEARDQASKAATAPGAERGPAVTFGGGLIPPVSPAVDAAKTQAYTPGATLNLSA